MTRNCSAKSEHCTQRAPWIYGPYGWICGGCRPKGGKSKCYHDWNKKGEYHVCSKCDGQVPVQDLYKQMSVFIRTRKEATWDDIMSAFSNEFKEWDILDTVTELLDDEFITELEEDRFQLVPTKQSTER